MAPQDQRNEFSGSLNSYGAPIVAGAQLSTAGGSIYIGSQADNDRLPVAAEALFNSLQRQHDPTCLPDTRVNLLNEIRAWADGQQAKCLWLSGMAGTGKSTIARTIAREYMDIHRLGASFFFSKGRGDAGNASKFVVTIAAQLAQHSPLLRRHVYDAVSANASIIKQGLHDQWKQLVVQPLARLDSGALQQPLLLVVDALDECDNDSDVELIVELLTRAHETKAVPLRVLLTSRPELPVRNGFAHVAPAAHQDVVLHAISAHVVAHDLAVFLRHRLGEVQRQCHLPATWPGEKAIQALLKMTGGLFIWADTACRFIRDGRQFADARLSAMLSIRGDVIAPEKKLDSIYNSILSHVIDNRFSDFEKQSAYSSLRRVLGDLALLISPLPISGMAKLLGMQEGTILQTLDRMRSVVDVSDNRDAVTLHHPSFRDFLLDPRRCGDGRLHVEERLGHQVLAERCLCVMASFLNTDICELRRPGALTSDISHGVVDRCIPAYVQYACLNWVSHYKLANVRIAADGKVHVFLKAHYLHWLEVLSLLRHVPDGVLWMKDLEDMLEREDSLAALVHDAVRFLQSFRAVIEVAPLQTYASALVFAPETCRVRKEFRMSIPEWICRFPHAQYRWTGLLQELEGHTRKVTAVCYSPDGQLLASASNDNTVRLWSSRTGALLSTLSGNSESIHAMAFSPDGRLLATAVLEGPVKLWRPGSSTLHCVIPIRSVAIRSVAFTPDGCALAIADWCTVRLWDMLRGALSDTKIKDDSPVLDVSFSPDGSLFAYKSQSWSCSRLRVYERAIGAAPLGRKSYSKWDVSAYAFSPDSQYLAFVHRGNIHLCCSFTGGRILLINDFPTNINPTALSFSHDSAFLACGTACGVRILNIESASLSGPLHEDQSYVVDVAYSPTGTLLASASDCTIKIWHPVLETALSSTRPKGSAECSVDVVSNGRLFAVSNASATSVMLSTSGAVVASLPVAGANLVAFSADGKYLAVWSPSMELQLWDRSSDWVADIDGHGRSISAAEFSPDGEVIATGGAGGHVDLWASATGVQRYELLGHEDIVDLLVFSADGAFLASAARDHTIKIWQPSTGALYCTLSGHALPIRHLSFPSSDGEHIASVSDDLTVRLWHMPTSDTVQLHRLSAFPGFQSVNANGNCLRACYRGPLRHVLADCMLSDDDKRQPRHVAVVGEWLVWGSERLLWLPPQYRPSSLSLCGDMVALGCPSGMWAVIGLDVSKVQALLAS